MPHILGVDPGYRNLGLAVIDVSGPRPTLVWSARKSIGSPDSGLAFVRFLWPILEELHTVYDIQGVATETPPFIMTRVKISSLLWSITTIIATWAFVRGIPLRHIMPLNLKRACCRALGRKYDRKAIPKKKEVRAAVSSILGSHGKTSHEDDAALAAILLYTKYIPDEPATKAHTRA